MFSFKYMAINLVLGFVAGALGNGNNDTVVRFLGTLIVLGSVGMTIATFGFGWGLVAFVELMVGAIAYGVVGSSMAGK